MQICNYEDIQIKKIELSTFKKWLDIYLEINLDIIVFVVSCEIFSYFMIYVEHLTFQAYDSDRI